MSSDLSLFASRPALRKASRIAGIEKDAGENALASHNIPCVLAGISPGTVMNWPRRRGVFLLLETIKMISIILLLAITSDASAQIDINSAEVQAAVRVKHDRSSSLPDGIAFRATIRLVNAFYEEDPALAIEFVRQEMGLSAAEARGFANHAVVTHDAIESENRQSTTNLACDGKAYDRNAHKVLEQMDDAYEDIAERYFQENKKRLGDENGARLQLWIDSQKHSTTYIKFDHEKLDQISGGNAGSLLTTLCSGGR